MNDRCFFDTNILIYAKFPQDERKQTIAQKLINRCVMNGIACISAQVMSEFINCGMKKAKQTVGQLSNLIEAFPSMFKITSITPQLIKSAMRISARYGFSFYDSLIVGAALDARCSTLYTEDLSGGQVIDGALTVVNPFE